MKTIMSANKFALSIAISVAMITGMLTTAVTTANAAATVPTLDLKVLLIGNGNSDVTTAAWESALGAEGVPYTEVDAAGTAPDQTVVLPALYSGTVGYYNGVVIADSPTDFASGALSALDSYESSFGVDQIDGYMYPDPNLGVSEAAAGALDGTTATLTAAGLAAFPALAGSFQFATGTYGYGAVPASGAPYTTLIADAAGQALAGVYQHPTGTGSSDPQAGVAELSLYFDYDAAQLQWLVLAPSLINWVTSGTHLGLYRNYVEMDIDDTFTPDNAWSVAVHDNDYSDADSLRMDPADVVTAADWSNPTQEGTPAARPSGEPSTPFRLDQLFNYGGTVEYQNGELELPGEPASGPDPLLAQFQAVDPATGHPYTDDFGWLSHTYDTPYLDTGCATQDYIEAELNENTVDVLAAPGAVAGTGGLGLTSTTDITQALGYYDPQVFVPGNHSGFADLEPGTPATVDPPDLDEATVSSTGGSLASGTYEYAVTDQFNQADPLSLDQSQAYVTDGLQGDIAPVVVTGPSGSVSLVWQAVCHAADYVVYRSPAPYTSWTEIGTYSTPQSATLPDNSSGDTNPAQTATVCLGSTSDPTSCAGEQELTFTDTGSSSTTPPAGVTYLDVPMPAGWVPPIVEDANELPWEQNPYFTPALQQVGITTVGADASKVYPDPPDDQFGIGVSYTGPTYAAGQAFSEAGSGGYSYQVAPRHPINIFYNVATNAQELDEYNTLYSSAAPDSQCQSTTVTTCSSTLFTFPEVISQVVSGMLQNMLSNNPEVSYVHQTNLMGTPPYTSVLPPANYVPAAGAQPGTDGDGTLYEVLNPLISEYDSLFNTSSTPYVQLTLGGIGAELADQTAWSAQLAQTSPTVSASETNGVVTVTNSGSQLQVPVTVPAGTTVNGTAFGQPYGGTLSSWVQLGTGTTETLTASVAPAITSGSSAAAIVGSPFNFTVTTTGEPAPALTETGSLPAGITFVDNGNGTATLAGTATSGTGGVYPVTVVAKNSAGTATQSFTLTNSEAPSITSAAAVTFVTTVDSTYTVTTTGYPTPAITETGTLPAGLGFVDNGNGTGTISGSPAVGSAGTYPVTLSAGNSSGSTATLGLVITVVGAAAPVVTSGGAAYFTLGQMGEFAVTATGEPVPTVTETGALPAGLSFESGSTGAGAGTAVISGLPTATGTSVVTVTASNGIVPNATQNLTVIVGQAPAITSPSSAAATVGSAFSFTVTTDGYPAPSIGQSGLPAGLGFVDNGNGTGTISGVPTVGDVGTYKVALTAVNGTGSANQTLVLTITAAQTVPAFTSTAASTFTVGAGGTFTVTATGSPTPALTETGALPAGVTFVDNGNGTATLSGTPAAGTGKVWPLTLSAKNSAGTATQAFTLTVNGAPQITSAATATATVGKTFSFAVTTSGYPAVVVSESGALPSGLTFKAGANGTGTISGTPGAGSGKVWTFTLTAKNTVGTTTQTFTLTVDEVPAITSSALIMTTVGRPLSFTVTSRGYPYPTFTSSALPTGLTLTSNANGTATISGTPTRIELGTVTIKATNALGTASQTMLIAVL